MKTLNLHTDGKEFYTSGTTAEYIGYYNITDSDVVLSGRAPADDSYVLTTIPAVTSTYNTITGTTLPDPVVAYVPAPTPKDYSTGWFMRYFARHSNDINAQYIEVDKPQFDIIDGGGNPLYIGVSLRWKISGPERDVVDRITLKVYDPGVVDTNNRSINQLGVMHPTLRLRLQNLTEFWSGAPSLYFGPLLSNNSSSLTY